MMEKNKKFVWIYVLLGIVFTGVLFSIRSKTVGVSEAEVIATAPPPTSFYVSPESDTSNSPTQVAVPVPEKQDPVLAWRKLIPEAEILQEETVFLASERIHQKSYLLKIRGNRRLRVVERSATLDSLPEVQIMMANQVIVKKSSLVTWEQLQESLVGSHAELRKILPDGETALVTLHEAESLETFEKALEKIQTQKTVAMAEPDYSRTSSETVSDPFANSQGSWGQPYADQWSLGITRVPEAWDHVPASDSVIVAVIDTGIDAGHFELAGQIWSNPDETPGNNIDDDGNGYIDDVSGWNFRDENATNLKDIHGHGTAMSGVIAAKRNNGYGIAGIAKNVKIMPLKNGDGLSFVSDNIQAIAYAVSKGAKVINMSFSGTGFSQSEKNAVQAAYNAGVVLVASSGNTGFEQIRYPAYHDEVISVGASTPDEKVAFFSTFNNHVDVVAPGLDILTLASRWSVPHKYQGYQFMRASGTSFSAAVVSGVVALIRQATPSLAPDQITGVLRNTATPLQESTRRQGYGRVDALDALLIESPPRVEISSPVPDSLITGSVAITGTATSSDFLRYTLSYSSGVFGESFTIIQTSTSQVSNSTLGTWNTLSLTDGSYTLQLEVEDQGGQIIRNRIVIEVGNTYGKVVPGWPKSVYSMPGSGTAADVDGNGITDFIGAGGYCDIGIVNGNGIPLPGWESVKSFYPTHNAIAPAAAGDLNGDGQMEVVFETRYQNVTQHNSNFTLHVYSKAGAIMPGWPKQLYKGTDFQYDTNQVSGPVLADIDADGKPEVLTLGADAAQNGRAMIYAFEADGSAVPGWPVTLAAGTLGSNSSVAVADLDGDGQVDIAGITGNGQIFVLGANGIMKPGWPVSLGSSVNHGGSVAFADFDHDASLELLATTYSGHIAIYESSGALMAGWPQQMPSQALEAAIADFDEDGDLEIVIPAVNQAVGGLRRLYVWHHDGTIASGWPYSTNNMSNPIILDFDGDHKLDIVASTVDYTRAFGFDGQSKSVLGLPRTGGKANHCLAADFTGDGTLDLLVTENVVPFSIAILNYPTRPLDPDSMPWSQPGINALKNKALIQARLLPLDRPILKLATETRRIILSGKNLIKGHRVFVDSLPCSVVAETSNQLVFDIPAGLALGTHSLLVTHASYDGASFPSSVIVVQDLEDYDGANSPNTWALRYQPEIAETAGLNANRGPTGDLDGDGISNILEFALRGQGYDATRPNHLSAPPMRKEADFWLMDYVFDTTLGLVATPQISFDLINWYAPGQAGAPASFEVLDMGPGAEPGLQQMRARLSAGNESRIFLRIRFE